MLISYLVPNLFKMRRRLMWTQSQAMGLFFAQPYLSMSRMPGFTLAMLLSSSHLSLLMNQQWPVSKKSPTRSPKPGLSRKDDPERSNSSFPSIAHNTRSFILSTISL